MDPQLIIFAIESAIRLGLKINEVLLDETRDRPLLLPLGELFGDLVESDATDFFDANRRLVTGDGPFVGLTRAELVAAFRTMKSVEEMNAKGADLDPVAVVVKIKAFEQHVDGQGPRHPAQRIAGTVIEIGIDYFVANPDALGKDSTAKRIVHGFALHLDDVAFAESAPVEIAGDVLLAALRTFEANVTLIDDDERLHALLGGVTASLIGEVGGAEGDPSEFFKREKLVKRLASSILRGGAGAFTENIDLFLPGDGTAKQLVKSTLDGVMEGIRDESDLFTNESLELIFHSALRAVGQNAELFTNEKVLQGLISSTVVALTDATGRKLFSEETAAAIVAGALAVVGEHADSLIDGDDPRKQVLASAVRAMALSLSDGLGASNSFKTLLSRDQVVALSQIVFEEVARNPEALIGDSLGRERSSALAQVVASVARALGDDPAKLVDGDGLIELTRTALAVGVRNADGLLALDNDDPTTNLLFQSLQQVATAVLESGDPRGLVSREGFLEIAAGVLPVVSANLGPIVASQDPLVQQAVAKGLELADGALQGRIDGANLPVLIRELLVGVVWEELDLGDDAQVATAAKEILRAAA